MKKPIIIWPAFIALVIGFAACEEEIPWQIDPIENEILVVEAAISNLNVRHLISLTHVAPTLDTGRIPASGAQIIVSDGNNIYNFSEFPANSGLYFADQPFRALFGKTYVLVVQYRGTQYSAVAQSVPVEPLSPIQFYEEESDLYSINFSEDRSVDPYYTRHFISWIGTNFCEQSEDLCIAKVNYYDLKNTDVNERFKPEQEQVLFPARSTIVRQKFSVSEEQRLFLRAILSETVWRGGLFDIERGNVPTNLSSGALGFFSVSTVVTDTTIVQ